MSSKHALVSALALALACLSSCVTESSDDDGDNGGSGSNATCATVSGTWQLSGGCGDDVCTITQSGCRLSQVSCVSGSRSTVGTVTGNEFTYDGYGAGGGGALSTCSGSASGSTLTGTCRPANGGGTTCTFSASRR